MSLENWHRNDWLDSHRTTHAEISALVEKARDDLASARKDDMPAWRLAKAHNVILRCARAALAAAGYRAKRQDQHYRLIQSLQLTIGLDTKAIRALDKFRTKRHATLYDEAALTTETEARELVKHAENVLKMTTKWVREKHPDLLKE